MRWLPTTIAIAVGLIVLIDYFFEAPLLDALGFAFREWTIILTAFALLLGVINLVQVHLSRVIHRQETGAGYSALVVITATVVALTGLWFGLPSEPMTWLFDNVYVSLQSAFFALTAFFLATAAYRALRARTIEATWMLVIALIVFIGQTPLLGILADAREWVLNVPATAGVRGILIGVALGTMATALRLLLGWDRPYSG
ncbi:MAG: hypothetical protein N2559_01155 [Anaerolineae bacterium]|nr:hypothetical protein [Anaerolineae bacterium]